MHGALKSLAGRELTWIDALRQEVDYARAYSMLFGGPRMADTEKDILKEKRGHLLFLGAINILLGDKPSPNGGSTHAHALPVLRAVVACCRSGQHLIVFLERGPLYLVAASRAGEPEAALALQLDLLHAHFLAILTDSFAKTLARNPRFEPRRLLGVPPETSSVPSYAAQIMSFLLSKLPARKPLSLQSGTVIPGKLCHHLSLVLPAAPITMQGCSVVYGKHFGILCFRGRRRDRGRAAPLPALL